MSLKLYNTINREKEVFSPREPGVVRMYNCGPTVYAPPHIGNLRAYIFVDVLRRTLEWSGLEVKQIINITDVGHLSSDSDYGEDKMTRALKKAGEPLTLEAMKELGVLYTEIFKENLKELNIKSPEKFPVASEHIQDDIALIEELFEKNIAYRTSDGVYFDVGKANNYGALSPRSVLSENTHSRIEGNPEKKDPRDFALWKFNDELGWESPWGKGFPGWHIECSAMAMKYLGETLDIHTGGIDHIAIHHTNEIAQSEAITGKPFSRFWLHNNHLTLKDRKISKSDGDDITLSTLKERGFTPLAFRYFVLTTHYRKELTFSFDALTAAQNALERLFDYFDSVLFDMPEGDIIESYKQHFEDALYDDVNTPQALAVMWDMLRDTTYSEADIKITLLHFDTVLGFDLDGRKKEKIPHAILALLNEREEARKEKNFEKADELREKIESKGYEIRDHEGGARVVKKDI